MKDLMAKAKIRLLLRHVFFASMALSTPFVEDRSCPTAYTDMTKIGYNPDFIESLNSIDLVLFVVVHELYHIIFKHGLRRGGRDPELWNVASDHAINILMKDQGFKLWEHCLVDEKYRGMSAEQIYDILFKERQGKKGKQGQQGVGGQGQAGKQGKGQPGQGGMGGDVRPPPNLDPAERVKIDQQITQKVAQAASMARMAGQLSGELERIVGKILHPPLPWQELLAEYMTQLSHDDESWSRRNRRYPDVYLPSRLNLKMGEIVFITDISGSITPDEQAQVAAELNYVAEHVRPERMRVAYVDTKVRLEQVFEDGDPIVLEMVRGGGTDMRQGLKHVEQYDPIVVVLLTDGESPWPKEEPPYPLIVVCTTNADCPVGQVIRTKE